MDPFSRLLLSVALFGALILAATVGFVLLADVSWFESLYFTVITLTQVGYEESVPLDEGGMILTMVVSLLGVAAITFAVVSGIDFIVEGHLRSVLGRRRMDRGIASARGHTIVCGYGQVGRHVAAALESEGATLVVVDPDPDRVQMAIDASRLVVTGDASKEEVLRRAGIERASAVVACAHDDADNVLITLTARGINPDVVIVSRVKNDENELKATRAGADRVIAPAAIGGRRIAALVTRPGVVDFLDVVTQGTEGDLLLEEIVVSDGGVLEGRGLRELQLPERFGITVVALRAPGEQPQTRPDPDHPLEIGERIVVIGSRADLDRLRDSDV